MADDKHYIIANEDQLNSPHWGEYHTLRSAIIDSQKYANQHGVPVDVLNTQFSPIKNVTRITPYFLGIGERFSVYQEENHRSATVLGIIDDEVLCEYYVDELDVWMLLLTTVAEVSVAIQTNNFFFQAVRGKSVTHRGAPRKWLVALINAGIEWETENANSTLVSPSTLFYQNFGDGRFS